jgi:Ca2+-binding EF-hand superfamily protein
MALRLARRGITLGQLKTVLLAAFDRFDADGDGAVTAEEAHAILADLVAGVAGISASVLDQPQCNH